MMTKPRFVTGCFLLSWTVAAGAGGPALRNSDFAQVDAGRFVGWDALGAYVAESQTARVECRAPNQPAGLLQTIVCDPPFARPFTASARAKAANVADGGHFAVWIDLIYADGSPSWGNVANFTRGTHDWEDAAIEVWPDKPVKEIRFHLLLRQTTGQAWFAQPRLFETPVRVSRTQVVIGQWGPGSVSLRAETNLPSLIEVHGLTPPAGSQPASPPRSQILAFDTLHAPESLLTGEITLTARAIDNPENRVTLNLKPTVAQGIGAPAFRAWTTHITDRIFTDTLAPAVPASEPIVIDAVRGERVSVQVAVVARPEASAQLVDVMPGEFTNGTGSRLPPNEWRRYRVGFIRNEQPAHHPSLEHTGPTWWPDPLLSWRPISVPPGQARSAVIDILIPEDQQPGLYQGHISVANGSAPPALLSVQVRVHSFVLPRTLRIKTAFALMDGFLEKLYGTITPQLRRAYTRFVLEHHLNPDDISRTTLPDLDELSWAKDHGMNAFNILNLVPEPKQKAIWVCFADIKDYTPQFKQRLIERLDAFVPELEKRGLLDMAYIYGFDERGAEYIPIMREYFGLIKQRYPRLHTLSTCWPPAGTDPASLNVDWYCPLSSHYDPAHAEKVQARGEQMWWYVCMGPTWPYANWLFEHPLVESRLIWWQTWQNKVVGFLYWGLNIWDRPRNERPIPDDADALLEWSVTPFEPLHGDGVLIYPGEKGPIGSLRLLNIRDGLADAAILDAAEARAGRERVEQVVRQISRGMADFTRDRRELNAARRELLDLLEPTATAPG